jgi:hypothetical protein
MSGMGIHQARSGQVMGALLGHDIVTCVSAESSGIEARRFGIEVRRRWEALYRSRGMPQSEIADRAGLSLAGIKRIMDGIPGTEPKEYSTPRRGNMIRVAHAVEFTWDDIDEALVSLGYPPTTDAEREDLRLEDQQRARPEAERKVIGLLGRMAPSARRTWVAVGEELASLSNTAMGRSDDTVEPSEEPGEWETVFTGPVPPDSPYQEDDEESEPAESEPVDDDSREAN